MFWLSEKNASKARLREAENARRNRAEIVAARSAGQVSRRELIKMGLLTTGGFIALKNGLSPFAKSAYADSGTNVTGLPSSPGPGAGDTPFTFPMLRLHNLKRHKLTPVVNGAEIDLEWPAGALTDPTVDHSLPVGADEKFSTRRANITLIDHKVNVATGAGKATVRDWPTTGPSVRGPREGRPPGEFFAHQRWEELIKKSAHHPCVGAVVSHGQLFDGFTYKLDQGSGAWKVQAPNAIWTFGEGRFVRGGNWVAEGELAFPSLLQARYGEPVILRDYNNLPFNPAENGGFGRNEPTTHNHNAHNGAESDGAGNAHFFPGQYYDYVWSTMLARHDFTLNPKLLAKLNARGYGLKPAFTDPRASSPTDSGDILLVPGDSRETDGTMWFHDHRIAFTSENVYKGYAALLEYFSGPDRGYETNAGLTSAATKVNLRLPSGTRNGKTWGNRDFDIYFLVGDVAFTPDGQQFFDVFHTDGFLGDVIHVNFQWKPVLKVLPRRYRFRILSAGMSRWVKLAITDVQLDTTGTKAVTTPKPVPFVQIANDGNLFPTPVILEDGVMDQQGTAERYDIIVDFTGMKKGKKLYLVNLLEFQSPLLVNTGLTVAQALSGQSPDPGVGPVMCFEVADEVPSVDAGGMANLVNSPDTSRDLMQELKNGTYGDSNHPALQEEIPTVEPVRTRMIELLPDDTEDSGLPFDHPFDGNLTSAAALQGASLGDGRFHNEHWAVRTNGGKPHHTDMRRASNLPSPGDVEHWVLKSGGGWFHPLHLHFEEAKTIDRNGKRDAKSIHPTELDKRKDVWHVGGVCCGQGNSPTIQVTFSEFGGAYVNHCHNTVHEDNAMLIRYHLISGGKPSDEVGNIDAIHATVVPTPDPRVTGVTYVESCHLPEGNPQDFNAGVKACPDVIGPVAGAQGDPPAGYVPSSLLGIVPPVNP